MRHLRLLFLLILVFVGIKMCASNNCDTIPIQQLNEIIIKSNKPHIKDENGGYTTQVGAITIENSTNFPSLPLTKKYFLKSSKEIT